MHILDRADNDDERRDHCGQKGDGNAGYRHETQSPQNAEAGGDQWDRNYTYGAQEIRDDDDQDQQ